ncbi:MAG: AAA family ATPase [Pseudomonadota bacterium]
MKLTFVEFAGFRGFRDKLRVEFGAGFAVICGRNGVGKSTLFDAVEYGLTGAIEKYRVEKVAKESIADYIWWRGDVPAGSYFVRIGFADENGNEQVITRTREGGVDTEHSTLQSFLCQGDAVPDDALGQMMRTSLIRDELIAALSLDLTETERFELVRAALGAVGGPDYAEKAGAIQSTVDASLRRANLAYETAREALNEANTSLSQARDAATRTGDISTALDLLKKTESDPVPNLPLAQQLVRARALLARDRQRLNGYGEAALQLRELNVYRQEIGLETLTERIQAAHAALELAVSRHKEAEEAFLKAEQLLASEQEADAMATALAGLIEHGEHVGLEGGHCPLCNAVRSREEFEAGLSHARARLSSMGGRMDDLVAALTAAQNARTAANKERQVHDLELVALENTLANLHEREERHIEIFDRYGLEHGLANDTQALDAKIEAERSRLLDYERAILTLDASTAVQQVQTLEEKTRQLRAEVDRSADVLTTQQGAAAKAKALERGVKLAAGEIIDERLSAISPLLNELYQRLRPHAEWKNIEYAVRGEVRRFLSLRVGDNLNPQFVFSSGQRRTAGLAFLLSVHLARNWCRWNSLLLDDPVQHIDDYRALNLVEVLAAIRQSGRQVICAVEDQSLADLLCRRLSGTSATGTRIDLGHFNDGTVAQQRIVAPLPRATLKSAKVALAAG